MALVLYGFAFWRCGRLVRVFVGCVHPSYAEAGCV